MSSALPADLDDLLGPVSAPPSAPSRRSGPRLTPHAGSAPTGLISEATLSDLLGLTSRRVRDLATDGVIPKVGPALYDQRESVRAYCEWLRNKAALGRGSTDPEYKAERTRLAREQADKIAQQNATARGEYLPASEVTATWSGILRDVRSAMLAVPSRIQARLSDLTAHDIDQIDREIRDALEALSDES